MHKLVSLLLVVVVLFSITAVVHADGARQWAGTEEGKGEGHPPAQSKATEVRKSDPDGGGVTGTDDWNHGCGNEPYHGEDDSNAPWCNPLPVTPVTPPEEEPVVEPVCKLVCYGDTCEIFPANVSPNDPANEQYRLGEGHTRFMMELPEGTVVNVLFWTPTLGHSAPYITVTCTEGIVVVHQPKFMVAMQ